MSRITSMTIGLVLIFIGAQFYLVKSYLLTPTATRFVQEHFNSNNGSRFTPASGPSSGWGSNGWTNWAGSGNQSISNAPAGQQWPYYRTDNASSGNGGIFSNSSFQRPAVGTGQHANAWFGPGTRFVPPSWIMWPAFFLGAVFFLHGAALKS